MNTSCITASQMKENDISFPRYCYTATSDSPLSRSHAPAWERVRLFYQGIALIRRRSATAMAPTQSVGARKLCVGAIAEVRGQKSDNEVTSQKFCNLFTW